MKFSEMDTKKLIDEYEGYNDIIVNSGTYGTRDLTYFYGIEAELLNRGYEMKTLVKWYRTDQKDFEEYTNEELLEEYNNILAKLDNYISEKGKKYLNTLEEIIRELTLKEGK